MMKVTLRFMSLVLGLMFLNVTAWAQPANDDCINAINITFGADEASAVQVSGDTRGGTASTEPTSVCSGSFYTDDIWFKFTTPSTLPADGIQIRAYFNNAVTATDVTAVGMALYNSCDIAETPIRCFSSEDPKENNLVIPGECLQADHEYVVRMWSTGNTPATEGTFRIAAFGHEDPSIVLWRETFGGGIADNGWTTEGTCSIADSNANANWTYRPTGLVDQGAYIFIGAAINSPTLCDGAVGVDSDYNDNFGIPDNFGAGPCPVPSQHILVSPEINSSEWTAIGLSLTWTQGIRQFQSEYFISYRTKDGDEEWSEWVDFAVNTEFAVNGNFESGNTQRHFLPGAAGHDFVQIRFVYNANYYMWVIDDVAIVETEANNLRTMENFFAIAPWATIPADQVRPYFAENDIYNAGAAAQTNVVLNHKVTDVNTAAVVYDENLVYGTIPPDFLDENKVFPEPVVVPLGVSTTYNGQYKVDQDQTDFDSTDNVINYTFSVGGSTFGHEDAFTRSVAVAEGVYDDGAPLSYGYGNVFKPTTDAVVDRIVWGVNNPADMAGFTVNVYLIQWTDNNGDQIAQNGERKFVGFAEYTFVGDEGDNAIIETVLDNFDDPGEPIEMAAGVNYFAMVEYVATNSTDPQFFLLASDARNYNATTLASDTAFLNGWTQDRIYMTVMQHSPDGIIANIDFEVRELDATDTRVHFSDDIVPMIRVIVGGVNTDTDLPVENLVSVYPNPAIDMVQVKLEFEKAYSDVIVRLIDNNGRTVYINQLNQAITQHVEPIRVSELVAGNYMLQVETVDGQRTVPVVVVK
jgi:hypothetical protein